MGRFRKFARRLAKLNTLLWNAVCETEGFVKSPIFQAFDFPEENQEFLAKLAQAWNRLKKNDDEFIEVELNASYFQEFDHFTNKIETVL